MSDLIRLDGAKELVARLEGLATKDATSAGQSAVRAAGKPVLAAIKEAAPVSEVPEGKISLRHHKGGTSREEPHHKIINNLTLRKARTKDQHTVAVKVTAGKAYQAKFVENGSIHNSPHPFMSRGLNSASSDALSAMAAALAKQIEKRGG